MTRLLPALISAILLTAGPAFAHDNAEEAKKWCTDAHMKQMDDGVAKIADKAKQKDAAMHLTMSKDAMKANDMAGCVKHMEEAHNVMGL